MNINSTKKANTKFTFGFGGLKRVAALVAVGCLATNTTSNMTGVDAYNLRGKMKLAAYGTFKTGQVGNKNSRKGMKIVGITKGDPCSELNKELETKLRAQFDKTVAKFKQGGKSAWHKPENWKDIMWKTYQEYEYDYKYHGSCRRKYLLNEYDGEDQLYITRFLQKKKMNFFSYKARHLRWVAFFVLFCLLPFVLFTVSHFGELDDYKDTADYWAQNDGQKFVEAEAHVDRCRDVLEGYATTFDKSEGDGDATYIHLNQQLTEAVEARDLFKEDHALSSKVRDHMRIIEERS
jgi:hypothetical protein